MYATNHLKTAIRNTRRNYAVPLINLFGLSTGVAALFLISTYASFERSYDDFHHDRANIYRVVSSGVVEGENQSNAAVYSAVGPAMKSNISDVKDFVRLFARGETTVSNTNSNVSFIEKKVFFADPSILEIFSLHLTRGDHRAALSDPFTVVFSESLVKKYFPTEDPLGRTIQINDQFGQADYKITGIFKELPANSHLRIDMLTSYSTLGKYLGDLASDDWNINWFYTYVLLDGDAGRTAINLNKLLANFKNNQFRASGQKEELSLQALENIHLYSNLGNELETNGNGRTVYYLIGIAALILIIAWLNYINLSTVNSLTRLKEVSVRKVIGASKRQLIFQFFIESASIQLIATLLGFLIFFFILPKFGQLVGRTLSLDNAPFSIIFTLILLGIIVSSLYATLFISHFKSLKVLTLGGDDIKLEGISLRKSLVVFQFTVAIVIISYSYVINRQMQFMTNKDLGMDISHVLVIKGPSIHDSLNVQKMNGLKEDLMTYPSIGKVSLSRYVPGVTMGSAQGAVRRIATEDNSASIFGINSVDEDFFETYQISMLEGRNFSKERIADDRAVVINEAASRLLGFERPSMALGQEIVFPYGGTDKQGGLMTIIGVAQNYHQVSLKEIQTPIVFWRGVNSEFSLKIEPPDLEGTLRLVKARFTHFFPNNPVEYHFLSDSFNQQYKSEASLEKAMNWFSVLSIIISCLGLFGLASFTIKLRNKEVGIRKVFGANFVAILYLLSKDYVTLIVIAVVIAVPLVYKLAAQWLQNFAYHIELTWGMFIFPVGLIFLLAVLTVLYHSVTGAKISPIESIRLD